MENIQTNFKSYSVTLSFWNKYLKEYLDELDLTYTSKVEKPTTDLIFVNIKISCTDEEHDKIFNFIKFPTTKQQRSVVIEHD